MSESLPLKALFCFHRNPVHGSIPAFLSGYHSLHSLQKQALAEGSNVSMFLKVNPKTELGKWGIPYPS